MVRACKAAILIASFLTLGTAAKVDAATPPPATAPAPSPLFAAYQRFCLTPQGEPAKALALAAAQGWVEPAEDDRLPLGALSMIDAEQRETVAAAPRLRLAVGHAVDPAGLALKSTAWRVCIVSGEPADPAAAQALSAWAAVSPMRGPDPADPASALFVIAEPPAGSRRSAEGLSDAALQALVDGGRVVAVGAKTAGPLTILLYAAPKP